MMRLKISSSTTKAITTIAAFELKNINKSINVNIVSNDESIFEFVMLSRFLRKKDKFFIIKKDQMTINKYARGTILVQPS